MRSIDLTQDTRVSRRTCLSLLPSTRSHLVELSDLFDVSEQSVIRAALEIASSQKYLKALKEHPERAVAGQRPEKTIKTPVGFSRVDDSRLEAVKRALYHRRPANQSAAVDAAVHLAWFVVRNGEYKPTPASARGPFKGQRKPVAGGRR